MKNTKKNPLSNSIVVIAFFCLTPVPVFCQNPSLIISERIAVTARPSNDSITLRWAPMNLHVWQWGNSAGYRIERYTLARNGRLLPQPEKIILTPVIKPLPQAQWEKSVQRDKYAAIAAQALFGERFELDLQQSDILTIINKVRENEQRFLFALFSADMSPMAARMSGLLLTDKKVATGEKYLYRVVINSMDSVRGSIYTSTGEPYHLPRPQNLKGDFQDHLVSLRWDKNNARYYTAYIVERSEDGKQFEAISDSPLVTVSPTQGQDTRYEYAMDSLKDISKIYYYRVKGITPFGEESPPSIAISGKGVPPVNQVPFISSAESKDNTSVLIRWDFPEKDNHAIRGFAIERSSQPNETFIPLTVNLLNPEARTFEDRFPQQSNYYRVTAHGADDALYPSHIYFAQLVDSLPPSSPVGLEAKADDEGRITLRWKPNTEPDIYGYRIYKAYHRSEEMAQITESPVAQPSFTDQVDLNTLNEMVYYRVMALDINQNHSPLSELLEVSLQDKVKPQPPVFLPVKSTPGGVSLSWMPGSSDDIVQYRLYRKTQTKDGWELLKAVEPVSDTAVHSYLDDRALPGQINHYTIVAIDDVGLESAPAHPVTGANTDRRLPPAIGWKKPRVNRELSQITIAWNYNQSQVQSFKIFRAVDDHPPVLFQTVSGEEKEFTHSMIPGQHYSYRIMALFADGRKSFLSDEMEFQY